MLQRYRGKTNTSYPLGAPTTIGRQDRLTDDKENVGHVPKLAHRAKAREAQGEEGPCLG